MYCSYISLTMFMFHSSRYSHVYSFVSQVHRSFAQRMAFLRMFIKCQGRLKTRSICHHFANVSIIYKCLVALFNLTLLLHIQV